MSKCMDNDNAYLDCQGYFDLASEILGLLAIAFFIYRAYNNISQYRILQMTLTTLEIGEKIKQKIKINQFSLIFLVCLMIELLISVIVFSLYFPEENAD